LADVLINNIRPAVIAVRDDKKQESPAVAEKLARRESMPSPFPYDTELYRTPE